MLVNSIEEESNFDKIGGVLQTLSIAFLICLRAINETITVTLSSAHGYLNVILIMSLSLFIAGTVIMKLGNGTLGKMQVTFGGMSYFTIIVIWYFFSLKNTDTTLIQFLSISLIPTYIVYKSEIQTERLMLCIGVIATSILPLSTGIFTIGYRNALRMDVSYAFLPCIISSILHIGLYFKESKKRILFLLDISSIYYFVLIFQYGMRGTLLSILVAIILMITISNKKKNSGLQWIIVILIIIGLFNLESILSLVQTVFNQRGVSIYFIEKFFRLGNELDHGRFEIWGKALEGFAESPIWGNGINSFLNKTGIIYPHNFILQFLFEGGLLIFIPFIIFFIYGTIRSAKDKNRNNRIAFILLFSNSVPYLFVSYNTWLTPLLWLLFGYYLKLLFVKSA